MGKVDQGFFTLWLYNHYNKKPLRYTGFGGQGHQVRDVLSIDDLCELISIQIPKLRFYDCPVFNVGGGDVSSCSLAELTKIAEDLTGNKIEFTSVPETNPLDVPWYITNNEKISHEFNWKPKDDIKTLAKKTFEWIKSNNEDLRKIFEL